MEGRLSLPFGHSQPLRKAVAGAPRLQAAESERPACSVNWGRARFPKLCQIASWFYLCFPEPR